MNANAIAIGTPSGDRYMRAASKFAFGDMSCFALMPPVLAGDRRKILGGTGGGNSRQPRPHPGRRAGILPAPAGRPARQLFCCKITETTAGRGRPADAGETPALLCAVS